MIFLINKAGDIKRIYSDITLNEITSFKLDLLSKRMIIGKILDCYKKNIP